eukprot:scpid85058/ scgid4523/ D-serine dehydratase; D-serine deaminase
MAVSKRQRVDVRDLDSPCMIVYESIVRQNCQAMLDRCKALGVQLRPHMKTHKTVEGARLMTGGSCSCIAVSTVAEAEFYADHGFDDILYAYPIAGEKKIERVLALHQRVDNFHVMVDHCDQLALLLQNSEPVTKNLAKPWSVFIDVDVGYNRTGVNPLYDYAFGLAETIDKLRSTHLAGLYVHCGHSYHCKSPEEIRTVVKEVARDTAQFAAQLSERGIACPVVGIGSTPSCSQPPETVPGITEFHPGNYIFYDLQQHWTGACEVSDIAVRVMTRVIGHYPDRNRLVIDCGFTAISKQHDADTSLYAKFDDHSELKLLSMSQELGIVGSSDDRPLNLDNYPIDKRLFILPYHSCAVAGLHSVYHVVDETDTCTATWKPCRGW